MPVFFSFLNLSSNLVFHVILVLARNIWRKKGFPGSLSSKATDCLIQLDQRLSKYLPWTKSINWEQVRDAKSQMPLNPAESETLGLGQQNHSKV